MKLPEFLERAARRWHELTGEQPSRWQLGREALALVEQEYLASDHYNLRQRVDELEAHLRAAQRDLLEERQLAHRRQQASAQQQQQLARIPQLENELRQRSEQESERLRQWIQLGEASGLFATHIVPKLLTRFKERQRQLQAQQA